MSELRRRPCRHLAASRCGDRRRYLSEPALAGLAGEIEAIGKVFRYANLVHFYRHESGKHYDAGTLKAAHRTGKSRRDGAPFRQIAPGRTLPR